MTEFRGYLPFHSSDPQTPYTFLYPAAWKPREIVHNGHTETFIAGPVNKAGTYAVSLTVGVSPAGEQTAEAAAASFLSRYRQMPGFQALGQAVGTIAGSPAVEIEIAYVMPLPLNNLNARKTSIRERHIFLKQGTFLYELLYSAAEDDYDAWLGTFQILVRTFAPEIQETTPARKFQPLVASPTLAHAVGEQSSEYEAGGKSE